MGGSRATIWVRQGYALVPFFQFGWHGNSFVVEDRRIVG
jgi:hypothetical protein